MPKIGRNMVFEIPMSQLCYLDDLQFHRSAGVSSACKERVESVVVALNVEPGWCLLRRGFTYSRKVS